MYLSMGLAPAKHERNSEFLHTEPDESSKRNHNPCHPGMTKESTQGRSAQLEKYPDGSVPNHITRIKTRGITECFGHKLIISAICHSENKNVT